MGIHPLSGTAWPPRAIWQNDFFGLPVISTNVGGVKDIIVNGKSGTLVEPNDLSNFTKNLTELVENEELRLNMGKYGEQFVFKKFHYKTFCSQMENIYYNLLKESNHN